VSKNFREQGFDIREVVIEENVYIGSNSVILPGVTIGKNSVIGAGSVDTKDIPPFSLAVGNPARVVKQYVSETGRWERV
jgi:acetyltransferase-like isoleucine patch superfamily enzyme